VFASKIELDNVHLLRVLCSVKFRGTIEVSCENVVYYGPFDNFNNRNL